MIGLRRALKKVVGLRTKTVGQLADDVGHGYGLSGDHRVWAVTPERQLGQLVAERLQSLMDNTTLPRSAGSVTDAFFGEREGLGMSAPPPARTDSEDSRVESTERAGAAVDDQSSSVRLPASMLKRPNWVAPALVAVTALVAGVVLALLFI